MIKKKSAFTLAEVMIMLVIVAIVMGLVAPLIAKKTQVEKRADWLGKQYSLGTKPDIKHYFGIDTALYEDQTQRVGIGLNDPAAKLHVKSDTTTASDVIFKTESGIDTSSDTTKTNSFIVKADGSTNARSCVPDYKEKKDYESGPFENDGYLVYNGCLALFSPASKAVIDEVCSPNYTDTTKTPSTSVYTNAIIPVAKGYKAIPAADMSATFDSFIPCATLPYE